MKTITIISLLTLTLLQAGELEKEIKYLGNDGTKQSQQIVCKNTKSGVVTIDNKTKEMTIVSSNKNIGKATFSEAVNIICQ